MFCSGFVWQLLLSVLYVCVNSLWGFTVCSVNFGSCPFVVILLSISCFACWTLDFVVCWKFCRHVLRGVCQWHVSSLDFCKPMASVRRSGHGPSFAAKILFFWFCTVRVGEAAVPGPSPVWSLGVCNPSGLANKGHLLDASVDCWAVCETHLSRPAYRQFVGMLRQDQSAFRWCLQGAPVPCRSTVSDIGAWSGVAFLSKWPSRTLVGGWPQALHESSRLVCTTTFLRNFWLSGVVVYGTPVGPTHPNAKDTTDGLLQAAIHRIAQSHGPRFLAGDLNHDLRSLQSISELLALGFREVQDLHFERSGFSPKATCRGKTQRDFIFVSPELVPLFTSCTVDPHAWTDHSSVVATFCGGSSDLCRFPWPIASAIPWDRLGARADGHVIDFGPSPDLNVTYRQLWQDVEQCAVDCADAIGCPLTTQQLGRGSRFQPECVRASAPPVSAGRKGDCQPLYFGSNWQHAHMFRQVRRLQSYVRLIGSANWKTSHREHHASLWRAILRAPGFVPSFSEWWQQNTDCWSSCPEIPVDPPGLVIATTIFEATRCCVHRFEKALVKHRAYENRIKKGYDMQQVYASVRRDPPAPVEVLLHSVHGVVAEVVSDEVAVELRSHTAWDEEVPFIHQGRRLSPVFVTSDKLRLESVEGISPGDCIVQHSGKGRLVDIFQAFIEQWSKRWSRHDSVPASQWTSILDFARLISGPSMLLLLSGQFPCCALPFRARSLKLLVDWTVFLELIFCL